MEGAQVPVLAYVAFGVAFACGLGIMASLYRLSRRLGLNWVTLAGQPAPKDMPRLLKLLWGFERADAGLRGLIWTARGLWAVMVACILVFALILARVA